MPTEIRSALAAALEFDPCRLSSAQLELLARHWELVLTWNRRVNLTSISSPKQAAWFHYADSLVAARHLPRGPIVDLGSGAGFPGIPLAIADPERPVTLVDSRRKRTSFLEVVAARLGLNNVTVRTARIESYPEVRYSAALTRAVFSSSAEFAACLDWVLPGGLLIAFRTESFSCELPFKVESYQICGQPRVLQIFMA